MKKIEFESNNKHWLVVDIDSLDSETKEQYFCNSINNFKGLCIDDILYEEFSTVEEITEEQALEVLPMVFGGFYTYEDGFASEDYKLVLHSLIKSKGVTNDWTNPLIFQVI